MPGRSDGETAACEGGVGMNDKAERRRRRAAELEEARRAGRRRRVALASVLGFGLILIAPIPITATSSAQCTAGTPASECETERELQWTPLAQIVWRALSR